MRLHAFSEVNCLRSLHTVRRTHAFPTICKVNIIQADSYGLHIKRTSSKPSLFHYFTAADICTDISDIPFSLLVLHLIMFTQFQLRLQPQTVVHMKTETGFLCYKFILTDETDFSTLKKNTDNTRAFCHPFPIIQKNKLLT